MVCDMPKPCKFPSHDSCQKKFLWTHVEDFAPHPVAGLVRQVGYAEKFPKALGFEAKPQYLSKSHRDERRGSGMDVGVGGGGGGGVGREAAKKRAEETETMCAMLSVTARTMSTITTTNVTTRSRSERGGEGWGSW